MELVGAIVLVVILIVHIVIHEFGHGYTASKIGKRPIESISFGVLCPEELKFSVKNKPIFIGIIPLLGSVNPVKEHEMKKTHFILYCFAGPLMNIIVSLGVFVLLVGPTAAISILSQIIPVIGNSFAPETMLQAATDSQAMGNSAAVVGNIVLQNPIAGFVLWFTIIGLSLGLTNLLPIPMLDGGQILFTPVTWAIPALTEPVRLVFKGFLFLILGLIGLQVVTLLTMIFSVSLIYLVAVFLLCMAIRIFRAHKVWRKTGKHQYNETPWVIHFVPFPGSLKIPLPRFRLAPLFLS